MTDEEMAEEYLDEKCKDCYMCSYSEHKNPYKICQRRKDRKQAFLAGLKAGRPQWHKITDWKDNSQFPKDELTTYLVCLHQDHYVICELDITEGYRQFYLSDNLDFIDPQDVIAWCELPTFDKE